MRRYILLILLLPTLAYGVDLGQVGKTYNISERDILDEIKSRAEGTDWGKLLEDSKNELKANIGKIDKALPKAPDNKTRYIDLTTTLAQAVYTRDNRGKPQVLYPEGYRFNVLDYTKIRQRFVFFDATRAEEVKWYKQLFASDLNSMPIITRGNVLDFAKEIKREVYMVDDEIVMKFKLNVTPTVIFQENNMLRAEEFYIEVLEGAKNQQEVKNE